MRKLIFLLMFFASVGTFGQGIIIEKLPNGISPTIDGTIENFWDTISVQTITKPFNNENPTVSAYWKAVWNDTAFFILVSVTDNFHCDTACSKDYEWMSDKPEVYFDVNTVLKDNTGPAVSNSGHFSFAPTFNSNLPQFTGLQNDGNLQYSYNISAPSYVFEYAINMSYLKDKFNSAFADTAGRRLGFDVCIIDRDSLNDMRKRAVWSNTGNINENWSNMDEAGIIELAYPIAEVSVSSPNGNISSGSTYHIGRTHLGMRKEVDFILKNNGQENLNISSITISGTGYSILQPSKNSLALSDTTLVKVYYQNEFALNSAGTLQINSNSATNSTFTIDLAASSVAMTIVPEGQVWGEWTKANSPYLVTGNLLIVDSAHLNIQPGVEVIFQGNYTLKVWGALNAKGKLGDTIVFKRDETDTTGFSIPNTLNGGWGGIFWDNEGDGWGMWDNDSSVLEYCSFKYGKATDSGKPNGGAIRSTFGKMRFSHCEFINNSAIYRGGAIYISGGATIDNCIFKFNKAFQGGAIFSDYASVINMNHCTFQWNKTIGDINSSYGGAIYLLTNKSNIQNNLIANNYSDAAAGAIMFDYSNDFFANNIVANNKAKSHGSIVLRNSNPVLVNNTIANNIGEETGGIAFWQASASKFYNNILWGNRNNLGVLRQLAIWDAPSVPVFQNCIIQKGNIYGFTADESAVFNDSIGSDPLFNSPTVNNDLSTDASNANWSVQLNSPAINKGILNMDAKMLFSKDYYNKTRVMNGFIDVGAAEAYIGKITLNNTITSTLSLNADTVEVIGNVVIALGAKLIIPPGTKILFNNYYGIKVMGAIIAKGTTEKPILFSKIDTSGFSNTSNNNGAWYGIHIDNDRFGANGAMIYEDSSIFQNCTFEFAKNRSTEPYMGGAITICYYSKVLIEKCDFRNNIGVKGGGLFITDISSPTIKNCRFYNNLSLWQGGALGIEIKSSPRIINNLFTNNKSNGDAGGVFFDSENSIFINNIICNNYASGQGGGIMMSSSNPTFSNNTVINNYAFQGGGGLYAYNSTTSIYNSVFWNNDISKPLGSGVAKEIINSSANFYNCNIKNYFIYGDYYSWTWNDSSAIISLNPKTLKVESNGLSSDFNISQFSGNINNGTTAIPGVTLPSTDFYGNPRVNGGKIDIGAVENQGHLPIILKQAIGGAYCMNDTITLSVEIADSVLFQWQKDGQNIAGANKSSITINGLQESNSGNYICVAKNAYGTSNSNATFIQVKAKPEILSQPSETWVNETETASIQLTTLGSKPLAYEWYQANTRVDSSALGKLVVENVITSKEGLYKCVVSNACGTVTSNVVGIYILPKLCLVTADSASGKNLVVWERKANRNIKGYNVYRESVVRDLYVKIGFLSYSKEGVFEDLTSSPETNQSLYKIAAVGANDAVSPMSNYHKTLFLQYVSSQGGVNLMWQPYEIEGGSIEFKSYVLYKGSDPSNLRPFDTISSSLQVYTDTAKTSLTELTYYRIKGLLFDACNSQTLLKAGGGPFVETVSNMEDNRLRNTGISNYSNLVGLNLYPQPATSRLTVNYSLAKNGLVTIEIVNLLGVQMATITTVPSVARGNTCNIDLSKYNLQDGMYFLKLKTNSQTAVKQFIIKH